MSRRELATAFSNSLGRSKEDQTLQRNKLKFDILSKMLDAETEPEKKRKILDEMHELGRAV
jgi:hypothetical protein